MDGLGAQRGGPGAVLRLQASGRIDIGGYVGGQGGGQEGGQGACVYIYEGFVLGNTYLPSDSAVVVGGGGGITTGNHENYSYR